MQKNTASQKWIVFAFEDEGGTNPGEPKTGDAANITANVYIDGGAANAVDDTNPAELGGGYYVFDITAAESNGECIVIVPTSSTANVNVIGVPGAVYTTPANFPDLGIETDGDVTKVNTLNGHTAQTGDSYAQLPTNFADLAITATTGRVDVGEWLGTAVAPPTTAGVPEVDITYIAGQSVVDDGAGRLHAVLGNTSHGGTGARVVLTASGSGPGLEVNSSEALVPAVEFENTASSYGLRLSNTSTGGAMQLSNTGSGDALVLTATGAGDALHVDQGAVQIDTTLAITGNLSAGNFAGPLVGDITGNLSGSVGSVTGSVGNVTGTPDVNIASSDDIDLTATQKATVNAEVDTAIETYGLDHLLAASVAGADVADNSVIAQLASGNATADWDSYDNESDSLEALRLRGDNAWTTGAGGTPPDLLQSTTIATLSTQTSFTLTDGSTDDDAYNGALVVVTDSATSTQVATGTVSDYTGSTKTVTLSSDPGIFTIATGDTIDIVAVGAATTDNAAIADAVLDEALSGHTTAGTLGKALADVETDATAIVADTNELQSDWADGGRLDLLLDGAYTGGDITGNLSGSVGSVTGNVAAVTGNVGGSVEGNVDGSVASVTAGVTLGNVAHGGTGATMTLLSSTTSGNVTAGNFAGAHVGDVTGNLSGSVGSVTGNVAAVTGNVGGSVEGNVDGSVASVTGNVGGIAGTITTLDGLDTAQDSQHATTQSTVNALPTLAEILAGGDVDGYTLEQTLKICLAALAGKLSGAATTTITIRAADNSKDRITATVDADGNRSAVTLDGAG